jgi:hypothetical protein
MLWVVVAIMALIVVGPFAADLAVLWWERAKPLGPQIASLAKGAGGRLATPWTYLMLGIAIGAFASGGFKLLPAIPLPSINWPQWVPIVAPAAVKSVYVIHETGDDTPKHLELWRELRADPQLAALELQIFDDEQPATSLAPIIAEAKKHTLPALVLVDASGKILGSSPVTDKASVITKVFPK